MAAFDMTKFDNRYDLCKAYVRLGKRSREIIDYLLHCDDSAFDGNCTDLTRAMGRNVKEDNSNIRKEVTFLHDIQVVSIMYGDRISHTRTKQPTRIALMNGWENNLVCYARNELPWSWLD